MIDRKNYISLDSSFSYSGNSNSSHIFNHLKSVENIKLFNFASDFYNFNVDTEFFNQEKNLIPIKDHTINKVFQIFIINLYNCFIINKC